MLAHLAVVEERRLHLLAGHGSLFVYCTCRLKMSEDEAYRRIRVARLARHFPCVLELVAGGQVSLSVMALVAPHVTDDNHVELLAAMSRKTVQHAREVLAAWFPKPDAPPSIRKLPERWSDVVAAAPNSRSSEAAPSSAPVEAALSHGGVAALPSGRERVVAGARLFEEVGMSEAPRAAGAGDMVPATSVDREGVVRGVVGATRARQQSSIVEPWSTGRYRVQFTADAELKQRIDLARDLLRHAVPDGDIATIVGRALELLIESTLRRRFGKSAEKGDGPAPEARASARAGDSALGDVSSYDDALRVAGERDEKIDRERSVEASPIPNVQAEPSVCKPCRESRERVRAASDCEAPAPARAARRFPAEARRTALERDGLRCSWVAPDGTRCNSRAWLEHDHITPHGRGGSNDAANGRVLCQPHNRLAAEQAYGQSTTARIIERRRATRSGNAARPSSDDEQAVIEGTLAPAWRARRSDEPPGGRRQLRKRDSLAWVSSCAP